MVRETFSKFKAVGRLKDKRLEIIDDKFPDGTDFRTIRGRFVIGVNDGEYACEVYMRDKFAGVDHKSNGDFDVLEELQNCELDTPIEVTIRTNRFNDYVGKSGKVVSVDCFNVNRIKILSEPSTDEKFEGVIEGMVTKCTPEMKNDEETGRLCVEITGISYNDKALPHNLFVEAALADDFKDIYELGSLAMFDVEIKTVAYGETKQVATKGFGRKADVSSGFTRPEWIIIGGDLPVDEERVNNKGEKLYIDPKEVKNLLNERNMELEQILKESKGKTAPKGGKTSLKAIKNEAPKADNPFDVDMSENPFL